MPKTARSKGKKRAVPSRAKRPRGPADKRKGAPRKGAPRKGVPRTGAPRKAAKSLPKKSPPAAKPVPAAKKRPVAPRVAVARHAPAPPRPRPALPLVGAQTLSFPPALSAEVRGTLAEWAAGERTARLWRGDAALWTGRDEDRWVGWLRLIDQQRARREEFGRVAEDVRLAGFGHVVVLGMGGSSLCPDVFARTFGRLAGYPQLRVLDSTVPAQIRALEREIDPRRTLFIVSSKSGTTLEPAVLLAYFLERVKSLMGADAGSRFVAITDPGTELEKLALREGFRNVFHGVPSVGGRFSALSHFGMVPAAAMGVSVPRLLDRAAFMADACAPDRPPEQNSGLVLGVALGCAARDGRDKLTLFLSPKLAALGDWVEQLVGESLGKHGKGIVPVVGEQPGSPRSYGDDRLFVHVRLSSSPAAEQDRAVSALERSGAPVIRIDVADPTDLGQEFFRWEIATAVAGSILGVNPFDQPDVETAKVAARRVTTAYEETGSLPPEAAAVQGDGVRLLADPANARFLANAAREQTPSGWLRAHVGRAGKGDYLAIDAFLESSPQNTAVLQEIREAVRQSSRVATTLGFGPRYLHSTGQLHKGGPNTGVFLVITADDAETLPVPGRRFGFGVLARAQARGDLDVLAERGRRAVRVHLGSDVKAGLAALRRAMPR